MYLPSLELNFDVLVPNGLGKSEDNSVLLLGESESGLVEVGLDVVELRIVLVFVLDLLLESLGQLLDALLNRCGVCGERSHRHHVECGALLHHLEEVAHWGNTSAASRVHGVSHQSLAEHLI